MILRRSQHTGLASLVDRLLLPGLDLSLQASTSQNMGATGIILPTTYILQYFISWVIRLHFEFMGDLKI